MYNKITNMGMKVNTKNIKPAAAGYKPSCCAMLVIRSDTFVAFHIHFPAVFIVASPAVVDTMDCWQSNIFRLPYIPISYCR